MSVDKIDTLVPIDPEWGLYSMKLKENFLNHNSHIDFT